MRLRLLRLILLAASFVCTLPGSLAQSLPFGTGFLPTFSFSETYTDTIVLGDFGYEQVPDGALSVSARMSLKGVAMEDMLADGGSLVFNVANLQLDLPLADAERSEASGYQLYTWPLKAIDPNTAEELTVGSVVLKYNTTELRITLTANHAPGSYSIYGTQEAGLDETLENSPLIMSISVGSYGLSDVLLYVNGTATVFDKTVGTGDNAQTFYSLARVTLSGKIDSTAPGVTLIYPRPNFINVVYTVTDRPLTMRGTCSDAYGVASVEVSINSGPFQSANISDGSWSLPGIELTPGRNVIIVQCTDQDGHVSTVRSISNFSEMSSLKVNAAGDAAGRVASDFFAPVIYTPGVASPVASTGQKDGAPLVITAIPAPNGVFDGWTSNKTLTAQQLASPRLSFKHQPNMTLTAHFLINPFAPVKGRYNGLATGATAEGNGYFAAMLSPNGTFTGSARIGTVSLKLKGKFSNTGRYTGTVSAKGVEYTVDLTLNVTRTGTEEISGTIVGSGVNVAVSAPRGTFDKLANPAPQVGSFNAIIPPAAGQPSDFPTGIGFGRVTVSASGFARFIGRTGTSPVFNAAAQLSPTGKWPFFCSLYGKRGSISGIVAFDLSNPAHDLSGTLNWFKPTGVRTIPVYLDGFNGQSTLLGSKFTPAAAGQRLFLAPTTGAGKFNVSATADGTLPALQQTLDATLGTNNSLTFAVPLDSAIQAVQTTVNPITGMINGSFTEGGTLTKFTAIVTGPKLNRAGGYFVRGSRTGAVEIVAAP